MTSQNNLTANAVAPVISVAPDVSVAQAISIVIPTHLPLARTRHLIEACLAQLGENDELIIVVDAPQYALQYTLQYTALPGAKIVVNEANIGAAAARNRGVGAAEKDIVLLLDSDSVLPNDLVESHRQAHSAAPDRIIAGKVKLRGNGRWFSRHVLACDYFIDGYSLAMGPEGCDQLYIAPTANLSAPRHIYLEIPFEEDFPFRGGSEDTFFCLVARKRYTIHDAASAIEQGVWYSFWRGIVHRVLRWGGSQFLLMTKCERDGLNEYFRTDTRSLAQKTVHSEGRPLFTTFIHALNKVGFLAACLRHKRPDMMGKTLDYQGGSDS